MNVWKIEDTPSSGANGVALASFCWPTAVGIWQRFSAVIFAVTPINLLHRNMSKDNYTSVLVTYEVNGILVSSLNIACHLKMTSDKWSEVSV